MLILKQTYSVDIYHKGGNLNSYTYPYDFYHGPKIHAIFSFIGYFEQIHSHIKLIYI